MTPGDNLSADHAKGVSTLSWTSMDVAASERYAYYVDGVCAAFMPLGIRVGPSRRSGFSFDLASHALTHSVANRVQAVSHDVSKGQKEVSASPKDCFYLNYMSQGLSVLQQKETGAVARPGEVILFESDTIFAMDNSRQPRIDLLSLMIPKDALIEAYDLERRDIAGPIVASSDLHLGTSIAELAAAFQRALASGQDAVALRLEAALLPLVAAIIDGGTRREVAGRDHHRVAAIHRVIRRSCHDAAFDRATCADQLGLSPRSVQRVLSQHDHSFSALVLEARLDRALALLRDPTQAHVPISTLARDAGFHDMSHFGRVFRNRFGVSPSQTR